MVSAFSFSNSYIRDTSLAPNQREANINSKCCRPKLGESYTGKSGLFLLNSFELSSFDKVVERIKNVLPVGFGQLLNIFQSLKRLFVQHLQIPIAHQVIQ
jgi:hypothetical protein